VKTKTGTLAALLLLGLGGCRKIPRPIDPLVILPAAQIEYINVTRLKPNGEQQHEFRIWDRRKVEEIVAELRLHNEGYWTEMRGLPPQEYAIALNSTEIMATMIWVGHGWLGGVDQEHKDPRGGLASHFRKLDPEQHRRLLLLVRDLPEE
jgi:hypothetical protein